MGHHDCTMHSEDDCRCSQYLHMEDRGTYVQLNTTKDSPEEIATGDSAGCVRIWDIVNCVETTKFHEHRADILALCVNHTTQDHLYATGVDSKVISITKTDSKGWVYTSCTRGQSHDISSLVVSK